MRPDISSMRVRCLFAGCVLLLAGGLSASPSCVLKGHVRDARTGEPLVGASVVIRGTEYGNAADLKGDYVIVGLPAMTGTATAAYAGYDDTSASFITTAACTTHLDFVLQCNRPPFSPPPRPGRVPSKSSPLPVRSETRLRSAAGCIGVSENILAIKQSGDSVFVQTAGRAEMRDWDAPSLKEGIIPVVEFQAFWDSLDLLGFWRLRNEYSGRVERTGEEGGDISGSFEDSRGHKTSKTVRYFAPRSCSLEFRRVYDLVRNLSRFASSKPSWKTLVEYENKPPIEGLKDWYHTEALRAIAVVSDSQDLDTLLSLLRCKDDYAAAVVRGLGSIGSKRSVPALEEFLARLEVQPSSWGRDGLILDAAKALIAIDGKHSTPAIRRFLHPSYRNWLVEKLSELLAGVGDYSGVPVLVENLSGPSRGWAIEYLKRIGYASQMVISALLQVVEKEMNSDRPDNGAVAATLSALRALTGQEFSDRPDDSLSVRRANMAGWLKWWVANAKRYPVGEGGPAGGYGFVQVNSKPSGAAISLDGVSTGDATPFILLNVPVGRHQLQLANERYADWSTTVKVARARTTTVDARLSETFGSLEISSSPSGVAISLDGARAETVTPHLFAKVSTGRHDLGLTKTAYPGWDSTVTVAEGEMTIARAMLKSPPESLWITYANSREFTGGIWLGPERAVKFDAHSEFGYPLHIAKVGAVFYLWDRWPWPDSSFRLKIYGGDGQTLLYQSPVLEAVPGYLDGPAVVHELSKPILVDSGEFYVSVAPIDTGGQPASLSVTHTNGQDTPSAIPRSARTDIVKRSYTGSAGHWTPYVREFAISVLLRR